MPPVVEAVSTITDKGQTTVPKVMRKALGVGPGDKLAFRLQGGKVILQRVKVAHRAGAARVDPVLGKFLAFLARDIAAGRAMPLTSEFAARMAALTKGKKVDLDAPIEGPVDL